MNMKRTLAVFVLAAAGVAAWSFAHAEELVVRMSRIGPGGVGEPIGTITFSSSPHGVLITPDLHGLPPGIRGFHLHENPACGTGMEGGKAVAGLAAGGHYDPGKTGRHEGPYREGHLGDLPALYVDEKGNAKLPVLAPRIRMTGLKGLSAVIHEGGDNYSDVPEKLGGGGGRIGCGVIGGK